MGLFAFLSRRCLLLLFFAFLLSSEDWIRPTLAVATPAPLGGANVRARRAQRKLKQSAEAVKVSELGQELVKAVVEESGKPEAEILPAGGERALVTEMAVAEGIQVTQSSSDTVRVFGASLMRRLVALTGSWHLKELPGLERVLITRTPPAGDERHGRASACVSVTGFDASEDPAPIIFVNGLEFVQMLFMVMATMHQASTLTETKDLLAFVPLLSTWRLVAQLQMLYYTFLAVPLHVALKMLEEEVLPSLSGDAKADAETKLAELQRISDAVKEHAPADVAPKDLTIQLDTSDATEKAIVSACVKQDVPLVRYGKTSLFLKNALKSRSSFFQTLHQGGAHAEDAVGELVQRAVLSYFESHEKSLSVGEFMKPEFWENEEEAAVTLDQVLEMTNKEVQNAFLRMQERLNDHVTSEELSRVLTSEYMTSEEAVKRLSNVFAEGIKQAEKEISVFYERHDARGLCELVRTADVKKHPWVGHMIYMYAELSRFCKKSEKFCQELLACLEEKPPELTAAMQTFEMSRILKSIMATTSKGGPAALAQSFSSELKAEAKEIESIESAKSEEAQASEASSGSAAGSASGSAASVEAEEPQESAKETEKKEAPAASAAAALSEEARAFLSDVSHFPATLRLTDLGMVRASLQAMRNYALSRDLNVGALARVASDCYFLEESPSVEKELQEAKKRLPPLQSSSGSESTSAALGAKHRKNKTKKKSRKRNKKKKPSNAVAGEATLEDVLRRHRAAACFVVAAEAPHMLSHHSPYDVKTPAKAARVLSKTHEQLRSSWKNQIFSESPLQRAQTEALMSYGVAPLSVDTLAEKRERVVTWLKGEAATLFNKCGDPAHITVKKDLPFLTTPTALSEKIMKIPEDAATVTKEGAALAPLVAEMLNVLVDNDFGSSFSPLSNRVLLAGEALQASNDKTPELTKALERMETRREKDMRDMNKSLFMSTPPGQIKLTFDVRGLRLWHTMMQVALDAVRRRKGHKRKESLLASRVELVTGRLNVLDCLARQHALTKVAAVTSSTAHTKAQLLPGCANTVTLLRHKRLLENTYETCLKEDTSPATMSKKRKGLGFKGTKEATTPASDSASAHSAAASLSASHSASTVRSSSHAESESASSAAHEEAQSHAAPKGLGARPLGSADGGRASADFLSRSQPLIFPESRGHSSLAAGHERGRSHAKKTKEEHQEQRRKKREEKKAKKEKAAERKAQAALAHAAKDGSATRKQRKAQARLLKKARESKQDIGAHEGHGKPGGTAKQQEPGTHAHQTHREGQHHEHDAHAEGKHHEHDAHAEGKHHVHDKHAEGKHAEGKHHEHDKHAEGKHHEHDKHAEGKHHVHDKHAEGKHHEHDKHAGGKSVTGHKESEGSASVSSTSALQLFDRSSPLLRHQRWERGIESHF
ncbi:UNVERIFIED_CONTAM: hypothetical protein HHA_225200 [Hammondia hammondi]|eukprot:XP_008881901.1 hypothetical protein HHA_225200 [Hammondia hammondi]